MNRRALALQAAFLVMGFGDLRGSFLGISRDVFGITAAQGALIPVFGALGFSLFAVPAGILATRTGLKAVLMAGLLVTAAAHAAHWFLLQRYAHLLAAIFAIGAGMTLLLVSGNPLLRDVSGPGNYARDLTFAQFVKSLGSIAGPYLLAFLAARGLPWTSVFPLFALASLAAFLLLLPVPLQGELPPRPATPGRVLALLREPDVAWNILGFFLFTGSEMGMNNFIASHMRQSFGMDIQGDAIRLGQGLFWVSQGAGRLLGTLVLLRMDAARFLQACVFCGLGGLLALALGGRSVAVAAVAVCGAAFANVWPALFALTLERRPSRGAEIAGLTVMANLGGAFVPLAMGALTDALSVRWCFLAPILAFVYLAFLARRIRFGTA